MKSRLLAAYALTALLFITLLWPNTALAGQCSATFSDGATSSHVDGSIKFEENALILNNPDGILAAPNVDSNDNSSSCFPIQCTSGGALADPIILTPFSFDASTEITIAKNTADTIGSAGNNLFKKILVDKNAQLTFNSQPFYGITKLEIENNGVVYLPAGDYYINELIMKKNSIIHTPDNDTVRLYIEKDFTMEQNSRINFTTDPSRVFIYAYKKITLKQNVSVDGYIFASGDVKLENNVIVTGSVSGKKVELKQNSRINYNSADIINTDFGGSCTNGPIQPPGPASVVAEYRFDQCSLSDNILDNVGSYNATPHGLTSSNSDSVIGRSLDLSATSTTDWVTVPVGAINGLQNFSTSIWINTSVSKSQQEILHALGSSTGDDELELYLVNSTQVRFKVLDGGVDLNSSVTLTDGQWHQLVITRTGSQACLYVDGNQEDCESGLSSSALSVSNSNAFVLGQEQDNYGGSFSSSQSFEGLMDEFKIYSGVMTSNAISSAYTNEKAGLNYDGTSRTAVSCTVSPISEYQFDETSYNGTSGEVLDSTGGFNGTAFLTQPIEGKVCNAADLTATGTGDYIVLGKNALDGKKAFSISLWAKAPDTTSISILSGANSSEANELIMWFETATNFEPNLHGPIAGNITTTTVADNNWHHLVWTRSNSQICLYRDKILQGCDNNTAATLDISSLILGQEQDSEGGGFDQSQAFDGLIDELVIFGSAIDAAQVSSIYDNQNNGLGYDGSTRTCPAPPTPSALLDMRFDETDWSGTNSVLDSSGSGHHGTAINSTPVPGLVCNAADLSADGTSDYLTVNANAMNGLTDFTAVVWGKTSSNNASTIISAAKGNSTTEANEAVLYFDNNNQFWPTISDNPFNDSDKLSTTVAMNDGNWHQLVWTRKASSRQSCFYFDGVLQGCITHPDGDDSNALQVIALVLGQDQDSLLGGFDADQDWEGLLDELLIFNSVLTQSQISDIRSNILAGNNWDGTSRNCNTAIDHYEITHDGQALTCAVETLTIKACLNAACSSLSTDPITLELKVGSTTVTTPTFTGSTVQAFTYTTPGDAVLSVSGASKEANSAQQCNLGGANDCVMNFAATGFLVNLTAGESCKAHNVTIQAVKQNENSTSCAPAYIGTQAVNLSFDYLNPVTGTAIPLVDNTALPTAGVAQQRQLTFDSTATATLSLVYNDAGSIRLNASATGSGPLGGLTLAGFDSAIYHPGLLKLTASHAGAQLDNTISSGTPTHVAGNDFTLGIEARCDNDAQTITANYQPEASDRIELSATRTAPNTAEGGTDGTLTISHTTINQRVALAPDLNSFSSISLPPGSFSNGVANVTANYSEVGLIQLDARDKDYFGDGVAQLIEASPINVGRFIPNHFVLEKISDATFSGYCANFVYTGQYTNPATPVIGSIGYTVRPAFSITPYNAQNVVTRNHIGAFNTLSVDKVDRTLPLVDNNASGSDSITKMKLDANISDGSLVIYQDTGGASFPWITQYNYDLTDNFAYIRDANAMIGEFTADIDFVVSEVRDNDGVTSNGGITLKGGAINVRYGRWRLSDTFGPESSQLAIPMTLEYYDGTKFVTNALDNCSSFDSSTLGAVTLTKITLDPVLTDATGSGTFDKGETQKLLLDAPGSPHQGQLRVTYDVPDWLGFDWDGTDVLTTDPSAVATFGQFRGNDRVIYWREIN